MFNYINAAFACSIGIALSLNGAQQIKKTTITKPPTIANRDGAFAKRISKDAQTNLVELTGLTTALIDAHQQFTTTVESTAFQLNNAPLHHQQAYANHINKIFGADAYNLLYPTEALKWAIAHYQKLTTQLQEAPAHYAAECEGRTNTCSKLAQYFALNKR